MVNNRAHIDRYQTQIKDRKIKITDLNTNCAHFPLIIILAVDVCCVRYVWFVYSLQKKRKYFFEQKILAKWMRDTRKIRTAPPLESKCGNVERKNPSTIDNRSYFPLLFRRWKWWKRYRVWIVRVRMLVYPHKFCKRIAKKNRHIEKREREEECENAYFDSTHK